MLRSLCAHPRILKRRSNIYGERMRNAEGRQIAHECVIILTKDGRRCRAYHFRSMYIRCASGAC